jgi:hypothetical protein
VQDTPRVPLVSEVSALRLRLGEMPWLTMSERKKPMTRLEWMAEKGHLPFDLDFVRAMGFRVSMDYDGEPIIESPESLDVDLVESLIQRFGKGIKTRLFFESKRARELFVGGPKGGQAYQHTASMFGRPILIQLSRGKWAVYRIRSWDDPRAFYVGETTSKKKARLLWFSQVPDGGYG